MKTKIIYAVIFLLVFFAITGVMIYSSSKFYNIFQFDFRVVEQPEVDVDMQDSTQIAENFPEQKYLLDLKKELIDSLRVYRSPQYDTVRVQLGDSSLVDNVKNLLTEIQKMNTEKQPVASQQVAKTVVVTNKDSVYQKWVKDSVKLYESMDTKKAAKIIEGFSDNIARDIIFSMKKKKAAEIIAEFRPEVANRIISLQ